MRSKSYHCKKSSFTLGTFGTAFLLILLGKIVLMILFSSGYKEVFFVPFVNHFLSALDNPWQYFYSTGGNVEFPYPPLMLYILSLFYLPVKLLGSTSIYLENFFFKLPLLGADLLITYILYRLYPRKIREILLFYFISPIVLYGSYIHSQLDLIPTALLMLAVYLLTDDKLKYSALVLGMAISSKFHIVAALPLLLIYLTKRDRQLYILPYLFISSAIYILFCLPYLFSAGFYNLVLTNTKQSMIFDVSMSVGHLKVYWPIFAALTIYGIFYIQKKVNDDLLYTFLGILFSVFIFFVSPAPGWYIWTLPYLSIFFMKYSLGHRKKLYLYVLLSAIYLFYFIPFNLSDLRDIIVLGYPLDFKIYNDNLKNLCFTFLEVILFINIYGLYKYGLISNSLYNRNSLVLGISGESGSGKTTLLRDIKSLLQKKVLELESDGDHKWERNSNNWKNYTHLDPKANNLHRQSENLLSLKKGNVIYRSDYDHATGTFTPPQKIRPRDYIIMCGLHPFYLPKQRKIVDLKIYVDTDQDLRQHWKILRDTRQRSYTKDKVIKQIAIRRSDAKRHIKPQKKFADMIIRYFGGEQFAIGDQKADPQLNLRLTIDSSLQLDVLVDWLRNRNVDIYWDYSDDLRSQHLVLRTPPQKSILEDFIAENIDNLEEILPADYVLKDGYRGIIQLIILMILTEKRKEKR